MKKTLIIIALGLILFLVGCNQSKISDDDRLDSFVNVKIDTVSQVDAQLIRFETLLREFLYQEETNLLTTQYPLVHSELDISNTGKTFYNNLPDSVSRVYALISNIDIPDGFREGESSEIGNSYNSIGELDIQINEDELYITHYEEDSYGRINGTFAYLSLIDDLLYVETSFVSYYPLEDNYAHHVDSVYYEDSYESLMIYYVHDGNFTGLYRMYQDFVEDTFFGCKIDNSTDRLVYYVNSYDPETETYSAIRNIDGEFSNYTIKNYQNNDFVYEITGSTNLFIRYNLKYIEEWDTLQLEEDEEVLYFNDTLVVLPNRIEVSIDEDLGVMLSGPIYGDAFESIVNLQTSVLSSPVTYQEYLSSRTDFEISAASLYENFSEDYFDAMSNNSEVVFRHLEEAVFERVAE